MTRSTRPSAHAKAVGTALASGEPATASAARPVKRSFAIAGHRTSISLEAPFWQALQALAVHEGLPVSRLIARIDGARGGGGLSSAVRIWILAQYRKRADGNSP
jgi:predicted DNA-binding ribbon-helix-helix protein